MLPPAVLRPILYILLAVGSVFLILLVLIQRGRGGGLAGALGGMGGYSAFGTRAGDVFTRVTIVAAALWILGAMALARMNVTREQERLWQEAPGASTKKPLNQPSGLSEKSDESASGAEEGLPAPGDTSLSEKKDKTDKADDGESRDR